MRKKIAVLSGDGIGQEIMPQAIKILNIIAKKFQHEFILHEADIGGSAFEKYGQHFPKITKDICQQADAILFGSVGGPITDAHLPKWHHCEKNSILALRQYFELNANIRPITIYSALKNISPLKLIDHDTNFELVIVRELIGDIYFGEHKQFTKNNQRVAIDIAEYSEQQIADIAHQSFRMALQRKKIVTSIDKANVLETSKLWRSIVSEIGQQYPKVKLQHMLVDNCAMQLIINPKQFDVILTSNLFGDILSDAAAALTGTLGMLPSASINKNGFGLYEPAGGSAPDIAFKNIANPVGQILSVALMLRYSFGLFDEAKLIENAIEKTLKNRYRTQDIFTNSDILLKTDEMTEAIISML